MALIGNRSVLHKSPLRFINGRESLLRSNFNKHGMQRNAYEQFSDYSAIPYGHLAPSAWVLPKIAGGMSSRNVTTIEASVTGLAYGGITTEGTASFTVNISPAVVFPLDDTPPARTASSSISFTVADATGQLISRGTGSASMLFSFSDALLTASIGGIGSASFTINTNTPLLGALANAEGNSSFSVTIADAVVYPLNDSSPLRTGTSTINFSGSLEPYAIGTMEGTTIDNTVLTADIISSAVWNALAADYNTADTLGNKLNTASTGGVDLSALVEAILEDARFKKVLTKGTFLALK